MQVRGSRLKASAYEIHKPSHTDTHGTANTMQRDFLQQQPCHQCALVLVNQAIVGVQDELPATILAAMILFARVDMAIFLALLGTTRWTRLSHDHSPLAGLLVSVDDCANHTTES
jgi:hypothetical protein